MLPPMDWQALFLLPMDCQALMVPPIDRRALLLPPMNCRALMVPLMDIRALIVLPIGKVIDKVSDKPPIVKIDWDPMPDVEGCKESVVSELDLHENRWRTK